MQEFDSCIAILFCSLLVCVLVGVCCFFCFFGLWRIGAGGEKLIEPEADIYKYIYISSLPSEWLQG